MEIEDLVKYDHSISCGRHQTCHIERIENCYGKAMVIVATGSTTDNVPVEFKKKRLSPHEWSPKSGCLVIKIATSVCLVGRNVKASCKQVYFE